MMFFCALSALLVLSLGEAIMLHPNQAVYFNRLFAGGLVRASENYETDYWRNSQK